MPFNAGRGLVFVLAGVGSSSGTSTEGVAHFLTFTAFATGIAFSTGFGVGVPLPTKIRWKSEGLLGFGVAVGDTEGEGEAGVVRRVLTVGEAAGETAAAGEAVACALDRVLATGEAVGETVATGEAAARSLGRVFNTGDTAGETANAGDGDAFALSLGLGVAVGDGLGLAPVLVAAWDHWENAMSTAMKAKNFLIMFSLWFTCKSGDIKPSMLHPQVMSSSKMRCWAEIDLSALRQNAARIRAKLGPQGRIMAIVKANAYGHGVLPVTRALLTEAEAFGVANLAEAVQLSDVVAPEKIFILGTPLSDERREIVHYGFIPAVSSFEEAAAFGQLSPNPLPVNITIDTGMGRLGVNEEDAVAKIRKIAALPRIEIKTISTHLPVSDEDDAFTNDQLARFENIVEQLRNLGIRSPRIHVLNSAGAIHFSGHAHDLARIGLALYGSSPIPSFQNELRGVMTLKTRVTTVRTLPAGHGVSYGRTYITPSPTRTAILGLGYADGYQRHLSNQGADVLIRGQRCPLLGRVTMDQIIVDITALPGVEAGEEVVLMGRQGGGEILASELAQKAGTIAWEIFTGISYRVERIYLHQNEDSAQAQSA